jgi:hypothetical protein
MRSIASLQKQQHRAAIRAGFNLDPSAGMPDFAAMPAALAPSATEASNAPTSVSLFDQGLIQVLEAAVSGLQPLAILRTNPDGAGIVQTVGPLKSLSADTATDAAMGSRRFLVVTELSDQYETPTF